MTEDELNALVAKMNGKPGDLPFVCSRLKNKSYGTYWAHFVYSLEKNLD